MRTSLCQECQGILLGRSDKKFCNDLCRNSFNNRRKSVYNISVRSVNSVLAKNRRILADLLEQGFSKVSKKRLLELGFQFSYHTHIVNNKKGLSYYFLYEYGFLPLEHDIYYICERKESYAQQTA